MFKCRCCLWGMRYIVEEVCCMIHGRDVSETDFSKSHNLYKLQQYTWRSLTPLYEIILFVGVAGWLCCHRVCTARRH